LQRQCRLYSHSHQLATCRSPLYSLFDPSAALLDLHSFPTRRSSDLSRTSAARTKRVMTSAVKNSEIAAAATMAMVMESSMTMAIDRKSTRLNSSHVAISYAVFCLKKKKLELNPSFMARP